MPPTPTTVPTQVVCENITDRDVCESYSQCYWYIPLTHLGPGECRTK
jgi:hypothetical protein